LSAVRTYLDYNATAPLRHEAREAVIAALTVTGNPSSVHAAGRAARRITEDAREKVAAAVGARAQDVVFTSGGTEANNLALAPCAPQDRLLVGATEHPSVLAGGRFDPAGVETIPVDEGGTIDLGRLEQRLAETPPVAVVSIMAANNETGAVQPVAEAAALARSAGALFHCDAVQAVGRIPLDIAGMGADFLTVSAHKLGGPQGTGALIAAPGKTRHLRPQARGGGQERSHRGGTENVAGIAGFGAAADVCRRDLKRAGEIARLRDWFEEGVRAMSPDVVIFAADRPRLGNTSCFAVPGIAAEKAVIALDLEGVAVSSGAACSSGKVGPSHVLAAMGVDADMAGGAIRVSLGWASSEEDIERFLKVWRRASETLGRKRRNQAA
jgi:cysteine desulfurase